MNGETLMTLVQAAATLPHRPHASTLFRWCRKGIRGVRLEYRRIGGRILVSRAALDRFGDRLAALDDQPPAPSPVRTALEKAESVAAAKARFTQTVS